jgi:putative SOS response-associated peptidase YedK
MESVSLFVPRGDRDDMCGRFGLYLPSPDLEERFAGRVEFDYEPRYNIAPEGPGTAAIRDETPDEINQLSWGLRPHWVDDPDDWHHPINARAETVAEKRSFRDAFEHRRCLVPANNFYEWTGRPGRRIPYAIRAEDQETFSMAGLWEVWSEDGRELQTFTILTTDANEVVGELHDRMPVILDRDEEQRWLEADDPDELETLLDAFPDERTERYEVSKKVNNPAHDGPELIEPVGSSQRGLDAFG